MSMEEKLDKIDVQLKYIFEKFQELDKMIHGQIGLVITEETDHFSQIKTKLEVIEEKVETIEKKID